MTTRHAPAPTHEASAPSATHDRVRVATSAPPATEGIIVVPSPPRRRSRRPATSGTPLSRQGVARARSPRSAAAHSEAGRARQAGASRAGAHGVARREQRRRHARRVRRRPRPAPSRRRSRRRPRPNRLRRSAGRRAARRRRSAPGVAHKLRATSIPSEAEVLARRQADRPHAAVRRRGRRHPDAHADHPQGRLRALRAAGLGVVGLGDARVGECGGAARPDGAAEAGSQGRVAGEPTSAEPRPRSSRRRRRRSRRARTSCASRRSRPTPRCCSTASRSAARRCSAPTST